MMAMQDSHGSIKEMFSPGVVMRGGEAGTMVLLVPGRCATGEGLW